MNLIPLPYRIAIIAFALLTGLAGIFGYGHRQHAKGVTQGHAETQAKWDHDNAERAAATLDEERTHARESLRRLEAQQENQRVQNQELAAARAAADRAVAVTDGVRAQSAEAARRWSDALAHSPTGAECAAAGGAISVQADLLGRAVERARLLAGYADTARAAGLKCERDYDSLTAPK